MIYAKQVCNFTYYRFEGVILLLDNQKIIKYVYYDLSSARICFVEIDVDIFYIPDSHVDL